MVIPVKSIDKEREEVKCFLSCWLLVWLVG
nr:MAG TPA: hypothetical protein [Caudoviricetes sp.]